MMRMMSEVRVRGKEIDKMMKVILLSIAIALGISFMPLVSAGAQEEITVSAAISLKNAFQEIGKLYEAGYPKTKILFNFGASGDLVRQIAGGAPVDVFASAAKKDMDDMNAKGLILPDTRADFAKNRVVLITPRNGKVRSFEGLASAMVGRIAAGNPRTVPAGRYAAEVFDYYRLVPAIKDKLIYAENVRQVLDYVARGEVDAGVVYSTDAAVRRAEVTVVAEAPESSHKPVVYPIAVVKGTRNVESAKAFISFVKSSEGSKVLEKYGFNVK